MAESPIGINESLLRPMRFGELVLVFILAAGLHCSSLSTDVDTHRKTAKTSPSTAPPTITYPQSGTIFPPEIGPPTVLWTDQFKGARKWRVEIEAAQKRGSKAEAPSLSFSVREPRWTPSREQWESIKSLSKERWTNLKVTRIDSGAPNSSARTATVRIQTSSDNVGAPIFFREVPLPFSSANAHPEQIRYRLGYANPRSDSPVLMENLPLCGNCHSFSSDGKIMGMDVDYANDKGSYAVVDMDGVIDLTPDKIMSWSEYKKDDGELTFGLLSRVSPDGKHVLSTVKDRSIFVAVDDNLAYSQLFFPIKGILVSFNRMKKTFTPLKGASDPRFVQSNPAWSPDGDTVFFARAPVYRNQKIERSASALLPRRAAAPFIDGKRGFRYDIYKVPFNNGSGGAAAPLEGASRNGMSNYFPKVSPDGKWVVFARSKNFMLLQPDSKLFIVPSKGGSPREMRCNTAEMNSWHSFSPNGRWMVFASKTRGPYTQLWLTHLDEEGNDAPPVLLDHLTTEKMAANIPEFVNIAPGGLHKIVDRFSDGGNYHYRIGKNSAKHNDLVHAIEALDNAVKSEPNNVEVYLERGAVLFRMGRREQAFVDFETVNRIAPKDYRGYYNLALALDATGDSEGALLNMRRAAALNPIAADMFRRHKQQAKKSANHEVGAGQ